MSRMADEMIFELAASLNTGMDKTAAKKDDDDKDDKKGGCPECGGKLVFGKCFADPDKCSKSSKKDDKDDKDDKKDKKKDDKKDKAEKKKKEAVMYVLNGLSKLAEDLDGIGADDASSLVDDALRIIVHNLESEEQE